MSRERTIVEQVSDFKNLYRAFLLCRKGKRQSTDYQRTSFAIGEKLCCVSNLIQNERYRWGGYKEFVVHDPKRRTIMCAPFLDRVVHHAICQIIDPYLDRHLLPCVYACRKAKGNMAAVLALSSLLASYGANRFAMKLDVEKYFASIDHALLLSKLRTSLPDDSLTSLLTSLLGSHKDYRDRGKGIPIGNLTSQLFANYYLASVDTIGVNALGEGYFRYMDDIILVGASKADVLNATRDICQHAENALLLSIPLRKRMPIAKDPVPFLGYAIDHKSRRVLSRTRKRFDTNMRRLTKHGAKPSLLAQMETSYQAWANLVTVHGG